MISMGATKKIRMIIPTPSAVKILSIIASIHAFLLIGTVTAK